MINYSIGRKLKERKAQILLPSVLLAPIFILVIYLLFETAKVSMAKVRHQFALDNAAYSQMSSASTYLNAMAMLNGPLPYRVMLGYNNGQALKKKQGSDTPDKLTIFDLFYKGGAFPSIGPDHENGINNPPKPEQDDWDVKYYDGEYLDDGATRAAWQKETPSQPGDDFLPVMSKKLTSDVYFMVNGQDTEGQAAIVGYLETYLRVGSIYKSQDYVFKEVSKNAVMFRKAYYLNVNDCKRDDCARQSASQIRQFLNLKTKPFELNKIRFYMSEASARGDYNTGTKDLDFEAEKTLKEKLFQFAYLDGGSRSKLKSLAHGILLKQTFKLPRNHFNINLEQKYKPYVRNRVVLSCPRNGNNCVWPNPVPKYSITLEP